MGRGDKKTKKGKIFKGSFGKSRPAKSQPQADFPQPYTAVCGSKPAAKFQTQVAA